MIYRIESVLDIKIQHHRDSTTTSRAFYQALQFGDLPLCASVRTEAFLYLCHCLVLFNGAAEVAVNYLGENHKLCARFSNRSEFSHQQCRQALGQECYQRTEPFFRVHSWVLSCYEGVDRSLKESNECWRAIFV
jgi:hypothetical protein